MKWIRVVALLTVISLIGAFGVFMAACGDDGEEPADGDACDRAASEPAD